MLSCICFLMNFNFLMRNYCLVCFVFFDKYVFLYCNIVWHIGTLICLLEKRLIMHFNNNNDNNNNNRSMFSIIFTTIIFSEKNKTETKPKNFLNGNRKRKKSLR